MHLDVETRAENESSPSLWAPRLEAAAETHAVHLVRAIVDAEGPDVVEDGGDLGLSSDARAAEDLKRAVDCAVDSLRTRHFCQGALPNQVRCGVGPRY